MLYFTRGETTSVSKIYKFGDFRLDYGNYELLRAEHPVKLERKPMELLALFASRQGQLVTRVEIAERLWSSDIYVDTEHGINTAIRKLRLTLRDDPAEPKCIKTVTGMGYCFVADVIAEPTPERPAFEASSPMQSPANQPRLLSRLLAALSGLKSLPQSSCSLPSCPGAFGY